MYSYIHRRQSKILGGRSVTPSTVRRALSPSRLSILLHAPQRSRPILSGIKVLCEISQCSNPTTHVRSPLQRLFSFPPSLTLNLAFEAPLLPEIPTLFSIQHKSTMRLLVFSSRSLAPHSFKGMARDRVLRIPSSPLA